MTEKMKYNVISRSTLQDGMISCRKRLELLAKLAEVRDHNATQFIAILKSPDIVNLTVADLRDIYTNVIQCTQNDQFSQELDALDGEKVFQSIFRGICSFKE